MPPSTLRKRPSSSAACRCSRSSAADDLGRVAEVAVPRRFDARRGRSSARATTRTRVTSCAPATPARSASTPTGATITLAHVRPRRHLRRAGDVRRRAPLGDRRGARRARGARASSAPTCAGCCARHPEIAVKLVDRAGAPAARGQRAARAPVLPDRAEPRRRRARPARRAGAAPRAPAARDVLVTATQAELAQLAGSSRESASRFLAVARARRGDLARAAAG